MKFYDIREGTVYVSPVKGTWNRAVVKAAEFFVDTSKGYYVEISLKEPVIRVIRAENDLPRLEFFQKYRSFEESQDEHSALCDSMQTIRGYNRVIGQPPDEFLSLIEKAVDLSAAEERVKSLLSIL